MTIPILTRIQCCQLRQSTFRKSGCLTPTEKQFAGSGFIKTGNLIECVHCEANANVDLTMHWTRNDMTKLHKTDCIFSLSDLDNVLRRAIFIRARRSRGIRSLCDNTVLSLICMGYSNEEIQKATTEFFSDYDAMPSLIPNVPSAPNYGQRLSTFGTSRNLSPTSELFATCGYVKNGATVECPNCGRCANVDLKTFWEPREIMRIHSDRCTFELSELEYIRMRAIFIRTRIIRGSCILSEEVLLRLTEMGFGKNIIIKSIVELFHDYGRYPEILDISEIVSYIFR